MYCPKCGFDMAATDLDCPRCIKFGLIEKSEATQHAGETALILAGQGGKANSAKALLAAGVDRSMTDASGETALSWAEKSDPKVPASDKAATAAVLKGGN